ncbi:MAG: hypothetical protein IPK79_07580 [Vampirovibrionales bacterium]|nr:hypothetical protein [Vampirovibrionales bacterium]
MQALSPRFGGTFIVEKRTKFTIATLTEPRPPFNITLLPDPEQVAKRPRRQPIFTQQKFSAAALEMLADFTFLRGAIEKGWKGKYDGPLLDPAKSELQELQILVKQSGRTRERHTPTKKLIRQLLTEFSLTPLRWKK